jgi:hypothetical protein
MSCVMLAIGARRPDGPLSADDQQLMTSNDKPTPLAILLAAMHASWQAGDRDAAVALARVAAPYIHPRIPAARPMQDLRNLSDADLDTLCSAERADASARGTRQPG